MSALTEKSIITNQLAIGLVRGILRSEVAIGATMPKAEAVSELEDPSGIRAVAMMVA